MLPGMLKAFCISSFATPLANTHTHKETQWLFWHCPSVGGGRMFKRQLVLATQHVHTYVFCAHEKDSVFEGDIRGIQEERFCIWKKIKNIPEVVLKILQKYPKFFVWQSFEKYFLKTPWLAKKVFGKIFLKSFKN